MKIAFVTDDGLALSAHLGRALFYVVVTLEDGKELDRVLVPKEDFHSAHEHGEHHQHAGDREHRGLGQEAEDNHRRMFAPIADCQVLVARGMCYGAQRGLQQVGIQAILTDTATVNAALDAYIRGELSNQPERVH